MVDTDLQPDEAQILAHLVRQTARWHEILEPHWLEIRMLRPGGDDHPLILRSRTDLGSLEAITGDIAHWNRRARSGYSCRNPVRENTSGKGAKDSDIIWADACWADCDEPEAAAALLNSVGPRYTYAVTTGTIPHLRPHPYWELVTPVTDMVAWNELQKRIAVVLGSDRAVVNPSRIMRIAGTVTHPDAKKRDRGYVSELATIRLEYPDGERERVTFEQLQRAFAEAPAQIRESGGVTRTPSNHIDMGGQESVDREQARTQALSGDEWHSNVIRLVASYVGKGLTDDEIHRQTDDLTLPDYTVEQTRNEVQTAINGARAKGWAPTQEYADPAALTVAPPAVDFDEPPAPARPLDLEWYDDIEPSLTDGYIIKDVLGDGAMSVVYGASNAGKTFFALDMAFSIATSMAWRGYRVRGGGVLYLAAEGGRGLINRVAALRLEHGACDVPLAIKRAGLDLLRSDADLQHIVDLAAAVTERAPLRLIVIDTLSRVMAGGDENSAPDMTALIRNLDALRAATGAHILMVHHSGKDAAKGARGHSSLRASTDTEIEVQEDQGERAAMVTKQRDYTGGQCFAFSLKSVELGHDSDGDQVTSCVIEETDSEEYKEHKKRTFGLGGNQKIIAETFDILLGDGDAFANPGGQGMPEPGAFWCVDYTRLRAMVVGQIASDHPEKRWNEAFKALSADRGLFQKRDEIVWRTDRPKNRGNSNG